MTLQEAGLAIKYLQVDSKTFLCYPVAHLLLPIEISQSEEETNNEQYQRVTIHHQ